MKIDVTLDALNFLRAHPQVKVDGYPASLEAAAYASSAWGSNYSSSSLASD